MIFTKIHLLHAVAALSLCTVAVSCSQNELTIEQGESLRPGEYPLTFTASVDGMTSRAAGHDSWVDGDEIGIRIGDYPKVGRYLLNADGSVMSAEESLDWQTTDLTTVTAWYPHVELNKVKTIEIDNQVEGPDAYDVLTAVAENQIYTNTVNLNFKHQMAKVSCSLVADDGITDKEFQSMKLSIAGFTVASFSNGVLTGSYKGDSEDNKWITPFYDTALSDYEAMVVPMDMTGQEFIKVEFTAEVNGNAVEKTLIYTPSAGNGNLQAGTHFKYKITVKKDRLEVQSLTASWEDDGEWHPAGPAFFHVIMPQNHNQILSYSDNVQVENEGNLLVKGNRFTISYELDTDNIKKALNISNGSTRDVMNRSVEGNRYVFSYYLLSEEIALEYVDYLQVGDYYYSDGSWGPRELRIIKTPIGVVFKVGTGAKDEEFEDSVEAYGKDWDEIHGYAVALKDVKEEKSKWGAGKTAVTKYGGYSETGTPYSGYDYTMRIKAWGESGNAYDAVQAALDYNAMINAPEASSGWYLPTVRQLVDIQNLPDRATLFTDAGGDDVKVGADKDGLNYWSCVERSNTNAYSLRFDTGAIFTYATKTSKVGYVRAVLTF